MGTGGSLPGGGSGLPPLPVPKLTLDVGGVDDSAASWDRATNGAGAALALANAPEVVAINVDPDLLDPALGLQAELLRYKRTRRAQPGGAHRGHNPAWVHPSHFVGGVGLSGSDTHGGGHGGLLGVDVAVDRPSEWAITSRNQVVTLTGALQPYFSMRDVEYFDAATPGSTSTVSLPCPTGNGNRWNYPGIYTRFAYSGIFTPGRFAVRYSIIGPDGRGRVTGPVSEQIACTTNVFPFLIDDAVSLTEGRPHATVSPSLVATELRCWFGDRTPR